MHCGQVPLATVCDDSPDALAVEVEYAATAVNDGTKDFYLRLARLVPQYNVVELKKMETEIDGRRMIPLGIQTNSISVPTFMKQVQELGLTIELERCDDSRKPLSE